MRIALVMEDHPAGKRFAEALRGKGIDVTEVPGRINGDGKEIPHAAVFVCGSPRATRAVLDGYEDADGGKPHVIAALKTVDAKNINGALKAGAVDVISIGACAEELVARVLVPTRISSARSAPREGRIRSCDGWKDAAVAFSDTLAILVGPDVALENFDGATPDVLTSVRMTCREDGSTADVIVGGSFDSTGDILRATGLDVTEETLLDFLKESSNLLAGRFKEHLTHEGVLTTLGLPEIRESGVLGEASEIWTVRRGGTSMLLALASGRGGRKMVPVRDLTPGMVLRHDVLNAAGAPFIRAGFALTERTVERLHEVLGDSFMVSVAGGGTSADAPAAAASEIVLF